MTVFKIALNSKQINDTHSFEIIQGDKISLVKNLFCYQLVF